MATLEATPGSHRDAPADPVDPPPSAWLPLTAGDASLARAEARPEHGGPGNWFIYMSRISAFGMGMGAFGAAVGVGFGSGLGGAWLAVTLAAGTVFQLALAREVERFTRWGWIGAVVELSAAALAKVAAVGANPGWFVGPVMGIGIDLVWLHYFWNRRRDFDIDLDL